MRVFITGATGYVGTAVVDELLRAGHDVVGLARSDESADALRAAGAEPHRGDLDDLDGLRSAAAGADGVIHAAFKHDLSFSGRYAEAADADLRAVEALAAGLEGSGRPLVVTSGTAILPAGRLVTEEDDGDPAGHGGPRAATEAVALASAARGIRAALVRLPPSVHSDADRHGFVPALIGAAREGGASLYVGDGANRWPAVHRLDAARLFRLALESAPPGARLHAVAEEGVPFREIAEAIGRLLGVPAASATPEEAGERLGWIAGFAAVDNPTSSAATQRLLGWRAEGPGLLADLEARAYAAV